MADHTIRQGATGPPLTFTMKDSAGRAVDLTDSTGWAAVQFHLVDLQGSVKVNKPATVLQVAGDASTKGQVGYFWEAVDTATHSNKEEWPFEAVATWSDGTVIYFPDGESNPTVEITAALVPPT